MHFGDLIIIITDNLISFLLHEFSPIPADYIWNIFWTVLKINFDISLSENYVSVEDRYYELLKRIENELI